MSVFLQSTVLSVSLSLSWLQLLGRRSDSLSRREDDCRKNMTCIPIQNLPQPCNQHLVGMGRLVQPDHLAHGCKPCGAMRWVARQGCKRAMDPLQPQRVVYRNRGRSDDATLRALSGYPTAIQPWGAVANRMHGARKGRWGETGLTFNTGWMHLLTGGAGLVPSEQLTPEQLLKIQ